MPAVAVQRLSYADYLALEATSEQRHEFCEGMVLAMAGGTMAHAKVKVNLTGLMFAALRGRPCQPYDSDQRIRVAATSLATYPDLSVVCGRREPDAEDPHAAVNPTVLFEVSSTGTAAYDRGERFEHYRRIPTLRQYVLVESTRAHVDVFSLNAAGLWELREYGPGSVVALGSVGIEVAVDDLYEGWEPDPPVATS